METKQNASRDAYFAEHTCRQKSLIANVICHARLLGHSCHVEGDLGSVHARRQIVQFASAVLRAVCRVLCIHDNDASASAEMQLLDTAENIRLFVPLEDNCRSVVSATSNASESSNIHDRDERITSKQMR